MKLMIQKIVSPHFIKSEVTQNIQTANKYSIVPLGTALPHIIYSTMNNWDFLKGSLTVLHPAVHTKSDGSSCVENKNMEFERGVQTLQTFTLQRTCPITGWVQMLLRLSAKHFIKSILRLFVLNYTSSVWMSAYVRIKSRCNLKQFHLDLYASSLVGSQTILQSVSVFPGYVQIRVDPL